MVNPFKWLADNVLWRIVWFWKKQTGWLDLNQVIEVCGTVISTSKDLSGDGDIRFNVLLDPEYEWAITGFGGRLTKEGSASKPAIHCEISPWDRKKLSSSWEILEVGMRVKVKGRWGFDGVHTGKGQVADVFLALLRHQPNINDGWFEIHPVEEIRILEQL